MGDVTEPTRRWCAHPRKRATWALVTLGVAASRTRVRMRLESIR